MAEAKSNPILGFTWTCLNPLWVISTGSSAVQILVSVLLIYDSAECKVDVLPEPVGPHTKMRPYGCVIELTKLL